MSGSWNITRQTEKSTCGTTLNQVSSPYFPNLSISQHSLNVVFVSLNTDMQALLPRTTGKAYKVQEHWPLSYHVTAHDAMGDHVNDKHKSQGLPIA